MGATQVYRKRRQEKLFWQLSDTQTRMMSDQLDSQFRVSPNL